MSIINCPFALDLKLNTSMGVLKNWLKLFHNGFSIGGGMVESLPPPWQLGQKYAVWNRVKSMFNILFLMHLVRGDIKTKNSLNVGNHPNQWGLRFYLGFHNLKVWKWF